MSLRRKLLAYGFLGVLAAAVGFVWTWRLERSVIDGVTRPHPYTRGRWDP